LAILINIPDFGRFKIGCRKRVIDIDWSATNRDFLALFDNINNTKGQTGIHAYGYDHAINFLTRVREALQNS
jgi:hypothetical protein